MNIRNGFLFDLFFSKIPTMNFLTKVKTMGVLTFDIENFQ